ncbi:hypothetical protein H5A20_07655 [Pectobacterium brasiliense]|uniref:DUF6971 family protein n=1 Tax=Pectobacterium brasiliense TaxID=180957 RepID=UPI001968AC1C|nr:hypothetical protein [Pectobacterium brasiliense]MBN3198582.1 hypothetical protein [Pectobacterium brasiliense]
MSIAYRKLDITLSTDKETVLVFGQVLSTKYFCEIVIPTMLNGCGNDEGKTNSILNDVHAAGLNAGDYAKYSRWWTESNAQARQEAERKRIEAEQHRERIAAMLATPAEIAAERAEKERRREEAQRKFGNKGAAFGL